MKVYIDYVFIENFIINISVIYQTSIFTKTKIKVLRLIILSIFLSVISVIKIMGIGDNILIQILSVNISIYLIYLPKKIITFLKQQLYYYLIYILYVGIIISTSLFFNISLNNFTVRMLLYIVAILISYIINKYMWKIWKNKIKYNGLTYKMVINSLSKATYKMFVDTGNNIKDPFNNMEVIILNSKSYSSKLKNRLIDNEKREEVMINILTAGGKSNVKGYVFNDISIKKGVVEKATLSRAIIVFIDEKINNDEYDGLISYNTYLEKLEGVTI